MRIRRLLLIAAVLGLVIVLIAAWQVGNAASARTDVPPTPLPKGATLVHIKTSDGIMLSGNFWPGKTANAPGLLMLHGIGSSRHDFDGEGDEFSTKGYAVLAINLRAHGDSGGDVRTFGLFEGRDAHAAFDWLKLREHGAKIGVIGSSLGAAAALLGERGPLPADAMVLNVVYPDIHRAIRNRMAEDFGWPLAWLIEPLLSYQSFFRYGTGPEAFSTVAAIPQYHGAAFVIGGERDNYTPPNETRELFEAAPGPKQLWIVRGADHNGTADSDDYTARISAFFDKALMPQPAAPG